MTADSTIDDTYEAFGESLAIASECLAVGEKPDAIVGAVYQLAMNAFFMLCAETFAHLKRDADAAEIHRTVSRALSLVIGPDLCAKIRRDRLLQMFPSLRGEGDVA